MQNLTLEELLIKRDQITGEILQRISDMRSDKKIIDVCMKLFEKFSMCNCMVLTSAYKGPRGERFVYGFDEIEESIKEEKWSEELEEPLCSINAWISEHRPPQWEPEIDDLFEELASICPYPIEEEIDWNGIDLDDKFEIIILKNGEYI